MSFDHHFLQVESAQLFRDLEFIGALLDLAEIHRSCTQVLVLAAWDRFEEFNFNLAFNIILAKICQSKLNLVPLVSI